MLVSHCTGECSFSTMQQMALSSGTPLAIAMLLFGTLSPVSAIEECGPAGAGDPFIHECDEGPYTSITYDAAATMAATSSRFEFTGSQVTGDADQYKPVIILTNEAGHAVEAWIVKSFEGKTPSFTAMDADPGQGQDQSISAFSLSTRGAQSPISFTVQEGLFHGSNSIDGATSGVELSTSGANSGIIAHFQESEIHAGSSTGKGGALALLAVSFRDSSPIKIVATDSIFTTGTNGSHSTASGIQLTTQHTNSPIELELYNSTVMSRGQTTGANANGVEIRTNHDNSAVTFFAGGETTISGGQSGNYNFMTGVTIFTAGMNSNIDFQVIGGIIAGGKSSDSPMAHGVLLNSFGDSAIRISTGSGSRIIADSGDAVYLLAVDGDILTDGELNGSQISMKTDGSGAGIGTGLYAATTGDGGASLHIGGTGIVMGTGAGLVARTAGLGQVEIWIAGGAQIEQTSEIAAPSDGLLPVGLSGVTTGPGDVTILAEEGSSIAQKGMSKEGVEGIAILGVTELEGNVSINAMGAVSATGIGIAAIAKGTGNAAIAVGGTVDVDHEDGGINGLQMFGFAGLELDGSFGALALASNGAASALLAGLETTGSAPDYGAGSIVLSGDGEAALHLDGAAGQGQIHASLVGVLGIHNGSGNVIITESPFEDGGAALHNSITSAGVGVLAVAEGEGDVTIRSGAVTSGGEIATVNGGAYSGGVIGRSVSGNVDIVTFGEVMAAGEFGVLGMAPAGDVALRMENHVGGVDPPLVGAAAQAAGNATVEVLGNLAVSAQSIGILAASTGEGDVTIAVGPNAGISATDAALLAVNSTAGTTAISIGTGAMLVAEDGMAVHVSQSAGDIGFSNAGELVGKAISGAETLRLVAEGDIAIHNQSGGLIRGQGDPLQDWVIYAQSAGSIRIRNDGTISGNVRVAATGVDADGLSIQFTSHSPNTWEWTGTNSFEGLGHILLENAENGVASAGLESSTSFTSSEGDIRIENAGTFNADGKNFFHFHSLKGTSSFTNSGRFNLTGIAGFRGLDEFINFGTTSMFDGKAGEILWTTGNFIGLDGSTLSIDAQLAPGGVADLLIIGGEIIDDVLVPTGGSLSGTTLLDIFELAGGIAAPTGNENAILFALVGGESGPSGFSANGGIDKGLFRYDVYQRSEPLEFPGFEEWVIASTPTASAFAFPVLPYAAQTLWMGQADIWLDRNTDLRRRDDRQDPQEESAELALWGRIQGGRVGRGMLNASLAPEGLSGPSNIWADRMQQDWQGLLAGYDFSEELDDGSWVIGLLGGHATSALSFDHSGVAAEYRQWSAGLYGSWLKGNFFLDAIAKADFGSMSYRIAAHSRTRDSSSTEYRSIGAAVHAGYRLANAAGWFIEPRSTLAYVRSSFDEMQVLDSDIVFADSESLGARVGLRAGTEILDGPRRLEPWLEMSLWSELLGDHAASIIGMGSAVPAGHDAGGLSGEASAGTSFVNPASGWSVFAHGTLRFGEDSYRAFGGAVGVRKTW